MGDTDDDARYPPRQYSVNHRSAYQSSSRSNPSIRNTPYPINSNYRDEGEYEDEYEMDDEEEEEEPNSDEDEAGNGYKQKKRKLDSLVNNYEFVARKPPQQNVRIAPADWTEQATYGLLEAWGERFLELGRKSLRSEDWQELAEKVSDSTKVDWTESQCRNRLDTLKKKYKKEKAKMEGNSTGYNSKWGFFKKMDMLLNPSVRQQGGLPCGVDSGEYVFMNSRVYLNRSNGLDEMRDSPGESEASEDEGSDGFPSKRKGEADGKSFRLLADSIHKFGDIYEKIESSKRQQMVELEKMRMDFQRDLEAQKKQILDRAQAEIAKIRQEVEEEEEDDDSDDDDVDDATDGSAENLNG